MAPLSELLELDRRVAAKDPGAWRAREVARSAIRDAWQLSEADGVRGHFDGGAFKVGEVEKHHAACLERLSRVPFVDVHSLELNALTSAELPACLIALEALKPQFLGLRGAHLKPEDLLQLARAPVVASLKQLVVGAAGPTGCRSRPRAL
jgi:hypothetical protein